MKDIESFLGTLNFWRKFVRGFSDIARPLNKLRQKDVPFVWTDECQKSFDALKQSITSAPVLHTPQPDLPYLLETDASGFAIGAILSQPHEGQFHPVGFFSKTLLSAERNYPTHDGELLAIVRSFEEWRHLLEGASHPVIVQTDNEALKFFMTLRILSRRQARWAEFLARFDFRIDYRPGKKNKADGLSDAPIISWTKNKKTFTTKESSYPLPSSSVQCPWNPPNFSLDSDSKSRTRHVWHPSLFPIPRGPPSTV